MIERDLYLMEDLGGLAECSSCSRLVPVEEFTADTSRATGRRSVCHGCAAATKRGDGLDSLGLPKRRKRSIDEGPAYLYRVLDEDGRLLYVGETRNVFLRFFWKRTGHAETSLWWDLADSLEVEVHETKRDALTAEAYAIEEERPPFNRRGGSKRGPRPSPKLRYRGGLARLA